MRMRKYFCYLDDGKAVYKVAVPAENEKKAREFCSGNGEIVAVKDVTDEIQISKSKVRNALKSGGFSDIECDFIVRALN